LGKILDRPNSTREGALMKRKVEQLLLVHCFFVFLLFSFDNPPIISCKNEEAACRVAVLIHGFHLNAMDWESVVFGKEGQLGRVPVGVEEAVERNASLIFWGSGSSRKDGFTESEYTYKQAIGSKLQEIATHVHQDPAELVHYLNCVSFLDMQAQNTEQELQLAIELCQKRGIKHLILVSSPTHIARCLQEACKIKAQNGSIHVNIYARPSDTCFANTTPSDVTIFEPPHREDRPNINFGSSARQIFPLLKNPDLAFEFHRDFVHLVEQYQHRLHEMQHAGLK
jgi:hypothetical protein